jgi:hypothetical protein
MHKPKPIKIEDDDFDATAESPELKNRTKRVISRKTEQLDKSSRVLAKHLRINQFTPKASSLNIFKTPNSKQ